MRRDLAETSFMWMKIPFITSITDFPFITLMIWHEKGTDLASVCFRALIYGKPL